MKGVTLAAIDPLVKQGDIDNMPGIVNRLIFGYHEDVATWPALPTGVADADISLAAAGALTGDVVMKSGVCAFGMDFTAESGSFGIKFVGEHAGEIAEYDLSLVQAKIRDKILGFQNAARGRKLFFIVEDENGQYYLMGDKRRGAQFVTGGDGNNVGKSGSTERNQTTLQFKYRAPRALVYTGDVEDLLTVAP